MKHARLLALLFVTTLLSSFSCSDLNVDNMNEPDSERVYFTEQSITDLANDLFRQWYVSIHSYNGTQMALANASDVVTISWNNQAMRWANSEPRKAWDNSPDYTYSRVTSDTYSNLYEINDSANELLKALERDIRFSSPENEIRVRAQAKLMQGISLGYIALLFDKGHFVDESSTVDEITHPEFFASDELMDMAIAKLEEAAQIADNNSFVLDDSFISTNSTRDNVFISQVAHSFIARFMANSARSTQQLIDTDWGKIEEHLMKALPNGLVIYNDQWSNGFWYNEGYQYLVYPGWGKVDMRIMNLMDDSYPAHNSNGLDFPSPDSLEVHNNPEIDNRIWTDYQWISFNHGPCGFRGCSEDMLHLISSFRHSRFDATLLATESGLIPEISKSELDMILAESYLHRNMLSEAAAIINNSERITRGGLPQVNAGNPDEIWDAIHQEVMIEQYLTGVGNEFFFMRRYDLLQKGTILHFPVPASVLEIIQGSDEPFYTFGGEENADGINTSNGGWR